MGNVTLGFLQRAPDSPSNELVNAASEGFLNLQRQELVGWVPGTDECGRSILAEVDQLVDLSRSLVANVAAALEEAPQSAELIKFAARKAAGLEVGKWYYQELTVPVGVLRQHRVLDLELGVLRLDLLGQDGC
ncbi:hypothetical protein AK812_SmicGene3787 [Symbiodinium microadriaticum]|uniref:Uncharacterized protein n=1 Tax=Symbiodinium microadriaticum TaxID=2951 RepID=A0A1Q9EXX6_SYMMI|nr:hypothetical protein AK812_SmicGene3787 [Symbiodinium microadriaticum]